MAYTTTQYETLQSAISSGALTVNYGDKQVTYRSLADMIKIMGMMEVELFPSRIPVKNKLAEYNKGIED